MNALLDTARDILGAFEALAGDLGTSTTDCPGDLGGGEPLCGSGDGCIVNRVRAAHAAIDSALARVHQGSAS